MHPVFVNPKLMYFIGPPSTGSNFRNDPIERIVKLDRERERERERERLLSDLQQHVGFN